MDPPPAARERARTKEELGPAPPEILQFESQVVPGLGEHGKGVPIGDHTEVIYIVIQLHSSAEQVYL